MFVLNVGFLSSFYCLNSSLQVIGLLWLWPIWADAAFAAVSGDQHTHTYTHLSVFLQDSVSYPLVSVGSQWRHFREGVCEFVSLLVRGCRNSLLYDDFLFSSFIALLTGLADSQVRAFRHTSTLIGEFGFSSELCRIMAIANKTRCEGRYWYHWFKGENIMNKTYWEQRFLYHYS